jgi:dTDP-4-amino-4,6-dideoxygalactose transaminase
MRRQLPVYSPLTARALLAGAAGMLRPRAALERAVRELLTRVFGADEVQLTDSGTGALALAIRAALEDGGRDALVALPAWACYDLATAALGADANVCLYDLDPRTLAPVPGSLRAALELGARAVVYVHFFGIPVVWNAAQPVRVIEDAAQAAGAMLSGRPAGSSGDFAILSFGRGKGMTGGGGGALLGRRDAAPAVRRAGARVGPGSRGPRVAVSLGAQLALGRPALYSLPASLPFLHLGDTRFHAPSPVRGISAVSAATLVETWPLGDAEAAIRRANAATLLAAVPAGLEPVRPPDDAVPGYLRLPVIADAEWARRARTTEAHALGIMPGYPRALCDLPGFADRVRNRDAEFPGARLLAERLVTLPVHSRLTPADLAALIAWLKS